ncbi:MAG: transcription termination factor Rho [Verrucomicrobiales bacterium]
MNDSTEDPLTLGGEGPPRASGSPSSDNASGSAHGSGRTPGNSEAPDPGNEIGGGQNRPDRQQRRHKGKNKRGPRQKRHHRRDGGGAPSPQQGRGDDQGGDGGTPDASGQRDQHDQHDQQDNAQGGGRSRKKRSKKKKEIILGPPEEAEGLLEISSKGFGFLRQKERNFAQTPQDVFVTPEVVRVNGLRDGLWLKCISRKGNRGPQLTEILEINGRKPDAYKRLPYFEELTAINPDKRIILEDDPERYTTRVIDMMTPIGRGQRGLIVAPPRTGKTTLLMHIGEAITKNYPDTKLMIMLIDERPEEVTEFTRALPNAEIMASSNDSEVKCHTRIAQLAIERAKRLVEAGEDVFILMDSITRLGRAFNNSMKGNGRTMSGGIDVKALEIPRKIFAAARNTREAGSLTIVATALVQTGSKMDELIFQEFKGTGNLELVLDRKLSEQYVYPAVDIHKSGTRREELLLPPHQLEKIYVIRRGLAGHRPIEAMERLLSFIERFPNNAQLLIEIKATAAA